MKLIFIISCLLIILPCSAAGVGDAKRGAALFDKVQCSQCHLNGNNMIEPDKPLKGPGFAKKFPKDEQIAAVIRAGRPNTGMPSTGKSMLSDAQLCDLIAYIRSLTPAQVPVKKQTK